ncbi:NADH-dependent flavin oxidoreductase [Oceanobacillus halophilus]|uniref:NADH-dependent flavin oxidoreductase n=1 Tax=Oceanobacillus halophilus TaxID=930130 RepID=A0A495A4K1_9BACI|nr:NADH-dependent flavin oxidoreductase [Oceanobacillus halophilus]RKQ34578.1 NADH-dependent flavin oxidoreductase [Oceanobacillus halophilus]
MNNKYQALFEPLHLPNGIELKNRIVMAPMTNYSSNSEDGTVTESEINYYNRRSKGVSAVITAVANVTVGGKGFPGEIGVYSDEQIPGLSKLADGIKSQGAKAILQIFHAGRMSPADLVPNGDVVGASDIPAVRGAAPGIVPRELTTEEVDEIIEAFGEATRRAIEAGFDGVEIHGANGYLIQQFFSPHSNRRSDRFGGDVEKRMTFPLAVIDKVQHVVKEYTKNPFIVGYRFSPEEPETPGITMGDTLKLVDVLADKKLDYLHVSLQDFWSKARREADTSKTRIKLLLEKINNRIPLIGVGSIYTADDAESAISTGVDLLALGRELVIDPEWVQKIEAGNETDIKTSLDLNGQEALDMPDAFWKVITSVPGWFPGVE